MNNLKYFVKLFIFWLIYFFVNRLFFIVNYLEEFLQFSSKELLFIIKKSVRLDISFIAYLSVIITILLFFNSMILSKRFNTFISGLAYWINTFFIFVSALIIGGEISLYAEWGTKLNFTSLSHFANPSEVFLTATYGNYFTMLIRLTLDNITVNQITIKQFNYEKSINFQQCTKYNIHCDSIIIIHIRCVYNNTKLIRSQLDNIYVTTNKYNIN